jgi:hypothetical protein
MHESALVPRDMALLVPRDMALLLFRNGGRLRRRQFARRGGQTVRMSAPPTTT